MGDAYQGAQGTPHTTFVRVIGRDQSVNDGLPGDDVAQDDQIVGGVDNVGLDPLGGENVFTCLCYHGMDLWQRVSSNLVVVFPDDIILLLDSQVFLGCHHRHISHNLNRSVLQGRRRSKSSPLALDHGLFGMTKSKHIV